MLRPRAEADLDNIADHTKAERGETPARRYTEDLRGQVALAAQFPGIGSEATGLPDRYRKVR